MLLSQSHTRFPLTTDVMQSNDIAIVKRKREHGSIGGCRAASIVYLLSLHLPPLPHG